MTGHYVYQDGQLREARSLGEWAAFIECCDRHVGDTLVGDVRISTVFLSLDHCFGGKAEPILFQTMCFGPIRGLHSGFWSDSMWRYRTLEQAQRGHELAVERVREFLTEAPVIHQPFRLGQLRPGERERFVTIIKAIDAQPKDEDEQD